MTKKIIRISAVHAGHDEKWKKERKQISTFFKEAGCEVVDGSQDKHICLSGPRGVQNHIIGKDGFVFFGKMTIGEMLKLCSLFVGTQTLDPDLHYVGKSGNTWRKPIISYGKDAYETAFFEQLTRLKDHGTIRHEIFGPEGVLRCPMNIEELESEYRRKVPIQNSIHGHGMIVGEHIPYKSGDVKALDINTPDFKVCVYTSARLEQDDVSISEARKLGEFIARKGWGLVTGLGATGLMREVHMGCVTNGGWSAGSNCPHIMMQEGIPEGAAEMWIRDNIYDRMESMFKHSDAIVISGGGRGGAGTFQEALGAILLLLRHSALMKTHDKEHYKPIIFDDRNNLWTPTKLLAQSLGLVEGKHFHFVKGSDELVEKLERIHSGDIQLARVDEKFLMPLA